FFPLLLSASRQRRALHSLPTRRSSDLDEIFAPVLSISRVKNLEEAIALTNQSRFANGACIFTNDGGNVRTFRETIDAGMLGVNIGVPAPMAFFPFSGWKDS